MANGDNTKLLRSLKLFSGIPDDQLQKLGEVLIGENLEDGAVVFEEGSKGDSLYFVTTGHVRIAKKLKSEQGGGPELKELAILGPGDCFGEMALIEAVTRSADAIASGPTTLAKLSREALNAWLKSHPGGAMGFFAQLVQVLSGRLRRSSNELTLLLDLSQLLLEPFSTPKALLDKVMSQLMGYLEGEWTSGAYVYNIFNEEMDLVDTEGDFDAVKDKINISGIPDKNSWLDDSSFQVIFPGPQRVMGHIVFHRAQPLDGEEKNEFERTVTTTARLITSALQNIEHRAEEGMRSRLAQNSSMGPF